MKFWSVVTLAIAACTLYSVSTFAADIFSKSSSDSGGCQIYTGKGEMHYETARDQVISYAVTLKVSQLGDGKDLLDYSFVINGQANRFPIIIDEESAAFQKVLVPTSDDAQDDYASYIETGWSHKLEYEEIHQDEGTPKKRTTLFSFLDENGNRITEHILAYRKAGKWQLTSTGSIGNTDGVIFIWVHKLSQTDECSPATN